MYALVDWKERSCSTSAAQQLEIAGHGEDEGEEGFQVGLEGNFFSVQLFQGFLSLLLRRLALTAKDRKVCLKLAADSPNTPFEPCVLIYT